MNKKLDFFFGSTLRTMIFCVASALIIIVIINSKENAKKEIKKTLYQNSTFKIENKVVFKAKDEQGTVISVYCSPTMPDCSYSIRLNSSLELIKDVKNFELQQKVK